jgi:hypothetical protein
MSEKTTVSGMQSSVAINQLTRTLLPATEYDNEGRKRIPEPIIEPTPIATPSFKVSFLCKLIIIYLATKNITWRVAERFPLTPRKMKTLLDFSYKLWIQFNTFFRVLDMHLYQCASLMLPNLR